MHPNNPLSPSRLHALDNLRAVMMWLGIVLHVAVIHTTRWSLAPWRDDRSTPLADLLLTSIHAFRMPVFFMLAGFLVALLLESRGPKEMARHRLMRLGLPFAIFWPIVFALTGALGMLYMHRTVRGSWGIDPALLPPPPATPSGFNTMHLWFLWMLLWLSLFTAGLVRLSNRLLGSVWSHAASWLQRLGASAWGFAVLALPLGAIGTAYPDGMLVPGGSFLPPLLEWLHYGLFFAFGLALFHDQWDLFDAYRRRWLPNAIAGLVFLLATGWLMESGASRFSIAYIYSCTTWLWSFAVIGLALRYTREHRPWLAYMANSSYWVYLVHLPLTIGFGALLYGMPLPAGAKMIVNIVATTALCLASYALVVRSTWIGRLLNGRKVPSAFKRVPVHVAPR